MSEEPLSSQDLEGSIQDFLRRLRRRGRSPNTIQTYGWGLKDFLRFCAGAGVQQLPQLSREVLERWQDSLADRLQPKSRQLAHGAVRAWLRDLVDDEVVHYRLLRSVESIRAPKRRPRPIPQQDLEKIVAHLTQPARRQERELRDRALFGVLLSSAARISECLQLRRDQLRDGDTVVVQKGGSQKELLISPTALAWVREYLGVRGDSLPELWVHGAPPRPLRPDDMRRIWDVMAEVTGVRRWSSHQVRHTGATELKRAGIPDLVVADHLGHANLQSLAGYAQVVDEQRQFKVEVIEGLLRAPEAPSRGFVRIRGDRRLRNAGQRGPR